MSGAIPLFPHTPSWHLIKLGDRRAFKIQNYYRVPYNCRQKYSKQILAADQDIFWDDMFAVVSRRIMVFCGMTSCSLVVMHTFGWTYSLLLQVASHGGSIFLRIVGVYQITRRHTPKDMILASPTLKDLLSILQESENFFGHFGDYALYVPRPNMFWNSSNVDIRLLLQIFSYTKNI